MTKDQQTILLIRDLISKLPPKEAESCHEIAEHLRKICEANPVGLIALALVGAEEQARS